MTAVSACSASGPDAVGAERTAGSFLTAVEAQDGGTACSLLAPRAAEELEASSGGPCDQAILADDVMAALAESRGSVPDAPPRAFGRQAQVLTDGQVVFLARDGDHWVVTAAGCLPRVDQPYDCAIAGG